jgi:hypothetical protein
VWRAWQTCPHAAAVPGASHTDEREIQRTLDGGALVLVVPTPSIPWKKRARQ